MDEFIKWVGQPEAYNWITLIAAFAATATAIFTGYSALALWLDRRKRVKVEWSLERQREGFSVIVSIYNGLNTTITGDRAIVFGPVVDVTASGKNITHHPKHPSWADNVAPLFPLEIAPDDNDQFRIRVAPSAIELKALASSRWRRPRFWLTLIAWRCFHWRFSSGVKFSIKVLIRRRSSQMRPIRLTHSIRIYPEQAIKMAEAIENSAAST